MISHQTRTCHAISAHTVVYFVNSIDQAADIGLEVGTVTDGNNPRQSLSLYDKDSFALQVSIHGVSYDRHNDQQTVIRCEDVGSNNERQSNCANNWSASVINIKLLV